MLSSMNTLYKMLWIFELTAFGNTRQQTFLYSTRHHPLILIPLETNDSFMESLFKAVPPLKISILHNKYTMGNLLKNNYL
jgi:hypothetical protein